MALSYACLTLQRLVIPIVLVLAALFRPVGISFVYLLMFFISPFIPVATAQNFKGSVTAYLIILIALSTILLLCHIVLQVAIITLDIGGAFGQCAFTEQLLRHIGFINFFKLNALAIIEWLLPEIVVFVTSIAIYLVTKKITFEVGAGQLENGEGVTVDDGSTSRDASLAARVKKSSRRELRINFEPLVKIAPMFCLATLFFSAVLRPSAPGGFYFIFFLLSGTYWASFQSLQRGFAILIRFVMVVLIAHIISVVSYQTPWMQQNVDNSTLAARLVGLEPLITSSCAKDIRIIFYETWFKLDSFLSPISLLLSYYILALTSKNLIQMRSVTKPLSAFGQLENGTKINRQLSMNTRTTNTNIKDSWSKTQRLNISIQQNQRSAEPTETTPLVRQKKNVRGGDRIESSIEPHITESGLNDIPMDSLDRANGEKGPSLLDQICYGIISVGGFIYQNSYIFTNILMMAWSIVYHSWLTFVFLLWANVLWMIPNQRKAMMRSSPFIVFYAEVLLIAQYLYGMNLTNDELPTSVNTTGINLQQIGLDRPSENDIQPCIPLIVKTSFLLMFWVTLRQFFKEKSVRKSHSTIADMVAPLQLTVNAATSDLHASQDNKKTSKFLKKAGDIIKNLLVRLWIWLLILVIFLCAITGVKMTGFRICYMAMFLFFLLVFQSSSKAWVKVMYGFWLFLIFYAMSILTLVYTYQFDKFDEYWNDYLNISKTLQEDIGLKKYETKDLFLHLVSPTIIVILTVIQVHYFHKRFIAALQHQPVEDKEGSTSSDSLAATPRGRLSSLRVKNLDSIKTSIKDLISRFVSEFKIRIKQMAKHFKGVCWRFLELHLIKAVYISAFVCCVSEVCVLHIAFCGLCIIGLISKSKIQTWISRIISLAVSIIILTKMIYQVQYISHEKYDVFCNRTDPDNNALWFGLQKATANGGLMDLIKKYIIFMVMVTLHAVVTLRQRQMRILQGESNKRPAKVLFPGVTRADADDNIEGMTKYLFNYGYHKFGRECTLITLVALITYRQDVFAIFYVIWLCALLMFRRSTSANIWSIFQCFTATLIFLQYLLLVGLPPGLCIVYPWNNSIYSEALQKWSMLPGHLNYSHVNKLIFDYILLLFINRQKKVFNVEKRYNAATYPGGSNKSVVKDIEKLGQVEFVNPTKDFLPTIRNYLDIIKNAVLCGFFWITLAVVFLAGTNISDLMAVGYLIGSFLFLWEGSDFYLRPIRNILWRWKLLLLFNVLNIALKTFLQIGGCLFLSTFQVHACWLIHMLGIVCKDGGDQPTVETDDSTNECPELKSHAVLVWDTVCFAFIILQLRIFKSHYFCHIINDTKANTILADRGAEIIEDLRQKQIEHRNQHELEVLHKIKRKMEKIRATQQKMLRPIDKPTHFDEEVPPLLRTGSFSSCHGSGYHTPIDDDNDNDEVHNDHVEKKKTVCEEFVADIASKDGGLRPYVPGRNSLQIHSPSLGGMTISFDGFLDTNRLSFDSTAGSDLIQKPASSDGSIGVFSPPPVANNEAIGSKGFFKNDRFQENVLPVGGLLPPPTTAQTSLMVTTSAGSSVISSTQQSRLREHRRQSSVNAAVSWNEPVSETCRGKEIDVPPAVIDVSEDVPVTLRQKSLHRRHLSMGNATYSVEENSNRHRYSNLSAPEESLSRRPNSWGPVDNSYYSESLMLDALRTASHAESIRAGDYYMFDDMDEKFELDLIEDEVDFLEDQGKIDESEKKMTRRKNLFEVCKEISSDRRKSFSRQRSYASAPGSRIGIKSDQPDIPRASVISDPLVYPDSCTGDDQDKSDKPKSEKHKSEIPSTSKDVSHDEQSEEDKKKRETESIDATDRDSDELDPPNPILRLLEAFMVSVVIRLNRFSRNYRYVMKILAEEKKHLKESKAFEKYGSAIEIKVSTPLVILKSQALSDDEASNTNALNSQSNTELHDTNTTTTTAVLNQPLVDINDIQLDTIDTPLRKDSGSQASVARHHGRRSSGVPGIRVMPPSVELGLDETGTLSEEWSYEKVDRTGDFTYEEDFATRDHHIIIEALISAWYAILSNTDLICYIIVFVNQVTNASIISLPLPLMVFLWGTLSLPRPTKTFWITLIAYAQALVLIKCVFQFKLIWANYINLPNQPLAPAKIIGVELNHQYANYDLLLLLVLFFHRFVLKSQGLWKSEYKGEVMQEHALAFTNKNVPDGSATVNEEQAMVPQQTEATNDYNTDTKFKRDSGSLDNSGEYMTGITQLTKTKYLSSFMKFFVNLVHKSRLPSDVYALMFLCDFINFFVLLFGFTAFGSQLGEGGVQTYLVENKVPIPFLIMLLVQFILIVIDRALYLRKALVNKIIFHFFSVIGIHIWMFFVIPAVTERSFYSLAPPIIFYVIKCFYLLLSSYQIKCGYPKRILGNFLTKGFSLVNMISFKVYMQIPFLFELRTILDWVCTDTTMTLFDWLKMEDIFSEVYFIKCGRQMETDFPALRAEKKAMVTKIALGGLIILFIVVAIWGPLCLFALGNAVGQSNTPYEVAAFIRIGPHDPIYETENRESIYPFDSQMFATFQKAYKKNRPAMTFLSNYDEGDIAAIVLKGDSPSLWAISPPDKERLLDDLITNKTLKCRFTYSFTRTPPTKAAIGTVTDEVTYVLDDTFTGREAMIQMLQGNSPNVNTAVIIPNFLPKFIKVRNSGDLSFITQLAPENEVTRPLVLKLHTKEDASEGIWWEIRESCNDSFHKNTLIQLPHSKCNSGVVMYTFNDKKFPSTFSFLTAGGIIGLYTTFVLLLSRLLKSFIGGQSTRVMYEELPYVDRVLQLCLDIYLVREALEFALEEDLFAKLLFLYRSPETMIKWTRPKEDTNDDETDTESLRSKNSHRRAD